MKLIRFQNFTSAVLLVAFGNLIFPVVPLCAQISLRPAKQKEIVLPAPVRTPTTVRVNREAPPTVAPIAEPEFSENPTTQEIFRARVFGEPFVPVNGEPSPEENTALAAAIRAYVAGGGLSLSPFERFLSAHPNSAWAPSVWLDLGLRRFEGAEFTKAIQAYESAWNLGENASDRRAKVVADRAIAELLQMHARLGHREDLERLFKELGNRSFTGKATELVAGARQGLSLMNRNPEAAYRCGPAALDRILAQQNGNVGFNKVLMESKSTEHGINLSEVQKLANRVGLHLQMAKRAPGAEIITPAVIHWKLGHYAALFASGGGYRVEDPTFGSNMYASAETMDSEASGYFLVPVGRLPAGWTAVAEEEGSRVWGKGNTTTNDVNMTRKADEMAECLRSSKAMTIANAHLMLVSLNLTDTPVGYAPPYGPAVDFTVTYNQREASQPSTPDFSNLGDKWLYNWLSFIDEGRAAVDSTYTFTPVIRLPGGGSEEFAPATGQSADFTGPYTFPTQRYSRTELAKTGSTSYVLTDPDGSKMTFGRRTGSVGSYRYFLTAMADPSGNAVVLGYDGSDRLTSLTDALGQVTTLDYDLVSDSLKITKVTDPFGRFATFEYDSSGRLETITDVIGIESTFTYASTSDFVDSLTTPYGTTAFAFGVGEVTGRDRWLEITDPMGDKERIESRSAWTGAPGDGPGPSGMTITTGYSGYRNTLFWDKKAWREKPNDPSAARITHWLHTSLNETSGLIENTKNPLESSRVWRNYEGQGTTSFEGTTSRPTKIGRVLDDSTDQISTYEYNSFGKVTKAIDPVGRETDFVFDSNEIDLLEVRQKTGSGTNDYEILGKNTYDSNHHVLTTTDAAGQVTTFTYNSTGQLSTIINAKSEVTSLFYDPAGDPEGSRLVGGARDPDAVGYLVAVDGPLSGSSDTTTFAYDSYGRARTVTDTEGYALTTDFDSLDRPTLITYPDESTQQIVYDKLDVKYSKDRRGRITATEHNAIREVVTSTDPLGRVTQFAWCKCGALRLLVDANGNATTWTLDVQGRVNTKTYPDHSTITYRYETSNSRLKSVTNARNQVATYSYFNDNLLKETTYTGAVTTPTVSFTYDSVYPRVSTMSDGVGTTTYAYNDIPDGPSGSPGLGAGRLYTIDGPWADDTIAYVYDELGRVLTRSINATANETTVAYDVLGRVGEVENGLGTFTPTYLNATDRLSSLTYPNGQVTNYSYYNNAGDQRLQQIENLKPNSSNLSTFTYTYDKEGVIQEWTRKYDAGSVLTSSFKYDNADQLTEAAVPTAAAVLQNYYYRFDKAGNRTSEQVDSTSNAYANNNLNQVTALADGGPIRFEGSLNEAGTVTVGGKAAEVAGDNTFKVDVPLNSGTQNVTVAATDLSNNTSTSAYEITVGGGSSRSLSYDADGSMTDNGAGQSYTWDSANRLAKIEYSGGASTEFTYDGLGRRVKIFEKASGGSVTSERRFVWCDGAQPCEERDGSNVVIKQFFAQGQLNGTDKYFYTADHLGSIREMTDDSGAIQARYDYGPCGRITKLSGSQEADFGFTGFYRHAPSELDMSLYRAFDADLGRWLSRDPVAEEGGLNLYAYCVGNPVNGIDPLGLFDQWDYAEYQMNSIAGAADSVSFGLSTRLARLFSNKENAAAIQRVKDCSGSFELGQWEGSILGIGRGAYALSAKGLSAMLRGGGWGAAKAAFYGRNVLKVTFRAGLWWGNLGSWATTLSKNETAEKIIAAAGRTNGPLNRAGVKLAAWAGVGTITSNLTGGTNCDCK